jgi:predicted anti-sigma-YlaC factor YlaD
MTSDCNEYRELLTDLVGDQLSTLQKQRLDQHLNQCDGCAESLQQLWQMQAVASRWDEQPVPHWNRRDTLFPKASWLPNLQWVSRLPPVSCCCCC